MCGLCGWVQSSGTATEHLWIFNYRFFKKNNVIIMFWYSYVIITWCRLAMVWPCGCLDKKQVNKKLTNLYLLIIFHYLTYLTFLSNIFWFVLMWSLTNRPLSLFVPGPYRKPGPAPSWSHPWSDTLWRMSRLIPTHKTLPTAQPVVPIALKIPSHHRDLG